MIKYSIKDKNGLTININSKKELAEYIGIRVSVLSNRLKTMTPQEVYDTGVNIWEATIKLKDGTLKKFTKKTDLADEIGINLPALNERLKIMTPQEAYDRGPNIWEGTVKLKDGTIKTFTKQKDLADEIGMNHITLSYRLNTMTPQEAYDRGLNIWETTIKLKDGTIKTFTRQKDFAIEIGLNNATLNHRLKTMTPKEVYDMGPNIWEATIKLKDGTIKTFTKKIYLANEIGLSNASLSYRLKVMTPQEAYDLDYRYYAFKEYNFSLKFFSKKYNTKLNIDDFNKISMYMPLEEYIIMKKLNCRDPEVCIDTENGIFVPIDKFCKDNNLNISNTLELFRNGFGINNII